MSKESSIKVFAENFSGSDKPVNAISVWLENASDIPGGGSIPSTVSGKWEDAKIAISYQDANTAQPLTYGILRYSATNDTTMIQYFNRIASFSTANALSVQTNANNYNTRTYKVVGINRISGTP